MRATDVMLVFLMLIVWGQNYQSGKHLDNMRQRLVRSEGCVRYIGPRGV